MTEQEFNDFTKTTLEAFHAKQAVLQAEHGFGSHARWSIEPATEQLELWGDDGRKLLSADVIDIGTYAASTNTWKWAWANDSVPPAIRAKALALKELAAITGKKLFESEAGLPISGEYMAWELAAFSVQHLNALGAYKAASPTQPSLNFLAITGVTRHAS